MLARTERVLSGLFDGFEARARSGTARADVAAAVLLEEEGAARARGGRVLARVERVLEWRGAPRDCAKALSRLRAPHVPVEFESRSGPGRSIAKRAAAFSHCR